jgi:hypothetical protein
MTSEQQRTVSRWFDEHPSVNTPDIYNPEWSVRVAKWKKGDNVRPGSEVSGNKLNFSDLFINHPVASIYLWNLLQAFHELDKAVCENHDGTKRSGELHPFTNSSEAGVKSIWYESLQNLKRLILNRGISNNDFMLRMYEIRCAVDKLDATLAELREVVVADVVKNILVADMLEEIESAVDWRFNMIDKELMFDNKEMEVLDKEIEKEQTLGMYRHYLSYSEMRI